MFYIGHCRGHFTQCSISDNVDKTLPNVLYRSLRRTLYTASADSNKKTIKLLFYKCSQKCFFLFWQEGHYSQSGWGSGGLGKCSILLCGRSKIVFRYWAQSWTDAIGSSSAPRPCLGAGWDGLANGMHEVFGLRCKNQKLLLELVHSEHWSGRQEQT